AGRGTPVGHVVLDEPDGQQVEPDERGHEPADQGGNAHGSLFSAHAGEPGQPRPVRRRAPKTDPSVFPVTDGPRLWFTGCGPSRQPHPTPSMASTTRVTVVTASTPWMMTTDSGKARSAGKSNSADMPWADSAATYAAWTGIHRVNMVTPSVAMPTRTPTAAQPHEAAPNSRWTTQNTSPVRSSRTWPRMTGPGSRLRAVPCWVASSSMSQTASR